MRVVHYLNQFFGGLGGEEKAAVPLEIRDGAIWAGKAVGAIARHRRGNRIDPDLR